MDDKIDKAKCVTIFNDKKYIIKENHTIYEVLKIIKFNSDIHIPPPDEPHRATIFPGGNNKLKFFKTTCKE